MRFRWRYVFMIYFSRSKGLCVRDKEGLEAVYWIKRDPKKTLGWFTPDEVIGGAEYFRDR
jgi:hypothetical protein